MVNHSPAGCLLIPALLLSQSLCIIFDKEKLVVEVLVIAACIVEIAALEHHNSLFEITVGEIYYALRVKGQTIIPCLEMQMWSGRATAVSAQTYAVAGMHYISHLDIAAGEVAVKSLEAVIVSQYHYAAVAVKDCGHTYLTVESGIKGSACRHCQVYALMSAPVAYAKETGYPS